ncbi:DUF4062 domain-containing protein [Carnobacterium maltaromaticum]|uniref:DUF4062 domain-containing protein n=1 Tax=Carnobacterium maltaromaticum TaxID=2751 RepID=UPI0039AEF81A
MESLGKKPTIFVSSTCYDLKQIRASLKAVIEDELGLEAMLSEYSSFPLDPSLGTVENCLRAVQERADILILIVGSRYGYVNETGKSVTNLEYLKAKEKGIPIYVFVEKKIISNMPIWKTNPTADFSSVVDNEQLFNFVDGLMQIDNAWVYEFEFEKEISERIKNQFAYLFYDSLMISKKLKEKKLSKKVLQTGPKAIQIILNQSKGWEHLYFSQVLFDSIDRRKELRRDFEYQIFLESVVPIVNYKELLEWITEKVNRLQKMGDALSSLINNAFEKAIGEPGESADLDFLVYVAEKIGDVYTAAIKWELELGSVSVYENGKKLVLSLSKASNAFMGDIEKFEQMISDSFSVLLLPGDETKEIEVNFELSKPDLTEYYSELEILRNSNY